MLGKPWYLSKTVWVNIFMAAGVFIQAATGEAWLDAEAQAALVVLANLILRIWTKEPVNWAK